jgi:hypothetical protein
VSSLTKYASPLPWKLVVDEEGGIVIFDAADDVVCDLSFNVGNGTTAYSHAEINAVLIVEAINALDIVPEPE